MTVRELIDELNRVEDKDVTISMPALFGNGSVKDIDWLEVEEQTILSNIGERRRVILWGALAG